MYFHIGDILSVPLFAHTRHFFVYLGNRETVGWRPKDGVSWMGSEGYIERKELVKVNSEYKWIEADGDLQAINLEKRTKATRKFVTERINQIVTGIDYHLGHRNCEHFANYITGQPPNSQQSFSHGFTDKDLFTSQPMISSYKQLKEALLRTRFCGYLQLCEDDFTNAILVSKLKDGYYVYHFSHPLGGQHIYVTSIAKSENFKTSYNEITLSYFGAFFGRGEILGIIRQLRGC